MAIEGVTGQLRFSPYPLGGNDEGKDAGWKCIPPKCPRQKRAVRSHTNAGLPWTEVRYGVRGILGKKAPKSDVGKGKGNLWSGLTQQTTPLRYIFQSSTHRPRSYDFSLTGSVVTSLPDTWFDRRLAS